LTGKIAFLKNWVEDQEMKVLLIEPPPASKFGNLRTLGSIGTLKADMAWPPLDLMIIAGLLKQHSIPVALYDANSLKATFEDVQKKIESQKPDLVIFTTSTPSLYHDLQTARVAKRVSRNILTAVTSTHVNALPKETLALSDDLDFCIPNDSEGTVLDLIRKDGRPEDVLGLTYRKDGKIIQNAPRPVCTNLDELGIPAHDLIDLDIYRDPFTKRMPMAVTYTSRGCINYPPCVMCSACFYNRVRYRSTELVMRELRWLKSLGVQELRFPFEAGFNDNRRAHELFDAMIQEKLGMTFTCNGRADCLSEEKVRQMKAAGCRAINIGCESTHPETVEFIKKRVSAEQVVRAVAMAKKAGLETLVYFLFGFPYETKESMKKTLEFAKRLDADLVTFGIAIPHPGTEFYRYLKDHGLLSSDQWDLYDPMFPPPYAYPELSSREIFDFARYAYRSYYLRPRFILKRFLKFNLVRETKNFLGFMNRYVTGS
jgi:radical SAM superfamily enzyme YgiQ (UPF0313 family)